MDYSSNTLRTLISDTAVYILCACVFIMASLKCFYEAVVNLHYVVYIPAVGFMALYFFSAIAGLKRAKEIDRRIYGSQRVPEDSSESG